MNIRINANPFFVDRDNFYSKNYSKAHGLEALTQICIDDISSYFQDEEFVKEPIWVLAIKGKVGSGKSLFARHLLLSVSELEQEILRPCLREMPKLRFEYLAINHDANKATLFLGCWRGLIQHLLSLVASD
jgi:hypothetical protein